jgi:tRNASer (uridine44-2'-O)-methyltransferase
MNFTAREKSEKVRNCTRVNRQVAEKVVAQVTSYLLSSSTPPQFSEDDPWYVGGSASLPELASLVSRDDLLELKQQCGGLQTLLKNNHHLFKVVKGRVEFRRPSSRVRGVEVGDGKWKSKPCWFFSNHPNGCPLGDELCSFDHVKSEVGEK